MRLVIDGQRLTAQRTGVGRCLESLLAEWAHLGLPCSETVVVLRDRGGLDRVPKISGLSVKLIGERWPGLAWECFGLGRELRRDDLLFAPANLIPLTWRGSSVLIIYDTLPWTVPESFPWHVKLRFGWRYRHAARSARRVIVPSQSSAHDVARVHGIPESHIRVVYPAPEPAFSPLPPNSDIVQAARLALRLDDAPYFLFVGKRSKRRNVPAILAAFAEHRRNHPTHRLVFVGPEGDDPLPGASEGVTAGGHVPEAVLHGLLADSLGLLYTSDYEGFGLPIVEAMASGCPVVTLRNSALMEAGGDAPLYLDAPRPEAIAGALRTLSDPAERSLRIARGLAQVTQFSRARFAREVKAELTEALACR